MSEVAAPSHPRAELIRFIVNGLVATAVHYGVLTLNLKVLGFESAGLANLCAAVAGITASFLGNRFYVFSGSVQQPWLPQALKFSGLYGAIAVLHGAVLWLWTDRFGLDYRIGFLVATVLQVSLSYVGNKLLVFKS
jgi:putative flippase GtrA